MVLKLRHLILLVLLLPASVFAGDRMGVDLSLQRLMKALSDVERIDAAFRETKEVALLDEPVILTGVLRYRAPDYVLKQVLLPRRESIEIHGDQLYIDSSEHGARSLRLSDYPAIGAFVASFRATLAGDLDSLKRHYRVELDGSFDDWRLRLEPTDKTMAAQVQAMIMGGSQARLLRIETHQADGGRSTMTITPSNE